MKMTAYRLTGGDPAAEFQEVEVPRPGHGELLLKVAGVGLCGTDLHFLDIPREHLWFPVPMTLGHEVTGWVEEAGPGVTDVRPGDAVVVAGSSFCGRCEFCVRGHTNYCVEHELGRGFGEDGGLSQFVAVPRHEVVPLPSLDPRLAAPLTDAGSTSYHAVKRVLPKLIPGSTAVVIGAGGLGGYAVQYLRRLSPARVVAVDIAAHRLDFARQVGADDTVLSGDDVTDRLLERLGDRRADVVLDFVGVDATMRTALACSRPLGAVGLVGAGGGRATVAWGRLAHECDLFIPMGYNIGDLREVVALAEAGAVRVEAELFPFGEAPVAFDRFRAGKIVSRAVVTPNG